MSRRAIVTGASRGIGRAIASRLMSDGWAVENLDREAPAPGGPEGMRWTQVDLADPDAVNGALETVHARGPVTGLVNNAAIALDLLLEESSAADFDRAIAIDLRAPMQLAAGVAPGMRSVGFGRIVNISSRAHLGKTRRTIYAAAKGGLISMTRVWALELAGDGITCNAVAPGPIRTELFEAVNPPDSPRTRAVIDAVPVGRLGEPEDIANAVAFFCDERASFVTGQVLYACGGVTLARGGN